jgi:CMP-N,N'-diacetyllegionaminic acid synthase
MSCWPGSEQVGGSRRSLVYKEKRILCVVPARGGSKGIPLKNLRNIGGVPLVGLAGRIAQDVPLIDRAVVSTDHEEIARVAQSFGLDAPFLRPEPLSGDRIGDVDVLTHALQATEADDKQTYDVVVMLQPTSPLRKAEHVAATIQKLVDGKWDSVWTVSPVDSKYHPLKQLTLVGDRIAFHDHAGSNVIARQQLTQMYYRNGIAYALTRNCLLNLKSLSGQRWGAVVLDGHYVSIDTEWDFELVEFIRSRAD